MQILHDLSNQEFLARPAMRRWRIEFDCHGYPFILHAAGSSEREAMRRAREVLLRTVGIRTGSIAVCISCLEVTP